MASLWINNLARSKPFLEGGFTTNSSRKLFGSKSTSLTESKYCLTRSISRNLQWVKLVACSILIQKRNIMAITSITRFLGTTKRAKLSKFKRISQVRDTVKEFYLHIKTEKRIKTHISNKFSQASLWI